MEPRLTSRPADALFSFQRPVLASRQDFILARSGRRVKPPARLDIPEILVVQGFRGVSKSARGGGRDGRNSKYSTASGRAQ